MWRIPREDVTDIPLPNQGMSPSGQWNRARSDLPLSGDLVLTHEGPDLVIRHRYGVGAIDLSKAAKSAGQPVPPPPPSGKPPEAVTATAVPPNTNVPSGLVTMVSNVNGALAAILAPFGPVIDKIPNPPYYAGFTRDLKVRPIDAYINIFSPFENLLFDSIEAANRISGVQVRRVGLPGLPQADVQMGLMMPPNIYPSIGDWLKRMKAINNFLILSWQDPVSLAKGIAESMVKAVQNGALTLQDQAELAKGMLQGATSMGWGMGAAPGLVLTQSSGKFAKALLQALKEKIPGLAIFQAAADKAKLTADFTAWVININPPAVLPNQGMARIVLNNTQMQEVYLSGDQLIARIDAMAKLPGNSAATAAALTKMRDIITSTKNATQNLVNMKDQSGYKGAVLSSFLTAKAAQLFVGQAAAAVGLSGYGGLGVAPVVAAGTPVAATGAGVTAAGTAAEVTAPATTPGIAALIAAAIAFVLENPELVNQGLKIVESGADAASDFATSKSKAAADKAAAERANAEAAARAAQEAASRMGPKPSTGSNILPLALTAGAVVAFPVVGPVLAIPLAAGAAIAFFKKK